MLWPFGELRGTGRWLEKEVLLADRLSRKATGRRRTAGMAQHYNHSENLAAASLQISQQK
jgi:hypothetical protein